MIREEATLKQRPERGVGTSQAEIWGKSVTVWENSQCKDPGAGLCLAVGRITRRPVWLSLNEQGERGRR